jgi:hypothetical protein
LGQVPIQIGEAGDSDAGKENAKPQENPPVGFPVMSKKIPEMMYRRVQDLRTSCVNFEGVYIMRGT